MKIEQITKDHVLKFAKPAQDQTKVLNYLCHNPKGKLPKIITHKWK